MARTTGPLDWGGSEEMTELESTMWRANKHPENSTQGGVLEILAGTPDWEELRAWHAYGLESYPRFRQKVVDPAIPVGPPVWVNDPDFDLDRHLTCVDLPEPGTKDQLLEAAAQCALVELDPSRPPWHGYFLRGLDSGGSAYFLVVNHTLMDGHGSVQLLSDLHTRSKRRAESHTPSGNAPAGPGRWTVAAGQLAGRVRRGPADAKSALSGALSAMRKPSSVVGYAASAGRVMAPLPPSRSLLFTRSVARTSWSYGVVTCPLDDLKAAGKAVGGTINDAYACAILGGIRFYHQRKNLKLDDITINMPVSVRNEDHAKGGNQFVPAFLKAPSSIADPAERMAAMRAAVKQVSGEPALDILNAVLPVLNRAPAQVLTPIFTSMQNKTDATISNVPGLREQAYMLGVPVEGIYYFGPLPGSPIMVVLYSYAGQACIGINCDGDVFDVKLLVECVEKGLEEMVGLIRQA